MALSESFIEISARVRNWGRWGDDDELGTLNLITQEAVSYTHLTLPTNREV